MTVSLRRIDALGLLCPVPVRLAEREVREMESGDRLEIVGDDPMLEIDIPAWCDEDGHRLVEIEKRDGEIRCLVEVG